MESEASQLVRSVARLGSCTGQAWFRPSVESGLNALQGSLPVASGNWQQSCLWQVRPKVTTSQVPSSCPTGFCWIVSLTQGHLCWLFTLGASHKPESSPYLQPSELCLLSQGLWNAPPSFQLFVGVFTQIRGPELSCYVAQACFRYWRANSLQLAPSLDANLTSFGHIFFFPFLQAVLYSQ